MNQEHLHSICSALNLGASIGLPKSVPGSRGGSFIWHVNTEVGSYAIKQLASAIDLTDDKIVKKFELSETVAHRFTLQGISAVTALEKSGNHLFIFGNVGYLIYPWVNAYTLGRNEVSEAHALKIAEVIAKLHIINLDVPEIGLPRVDIHDNDSIVAEIDKTITLESSSAIFLKESQSFILSVNDNYLSATSLLLDDAVVSHGDIDQLNVLWDKENHPIIIDWESVKKLNPTREIIRASLAWSGIGTNNSSLPIYSNMLQTYINKGGVLNLTHVNAALCSVFGSAINWILFNINIVCTSDNLQERNIANEEIRNCILSLSKFQKLIPDLIDISKQVLLSGYSDKFNE